MVRQHLEACASCRAELQAYEAVGAELALAVPQVEPPPTLEKRLLARIAPRPAPSPTWPERLRAQLDALWQQRRLRPVWATVAVILLLLISVLLWPGIPAREPGAFPTFALAGTDNAPEASGLVISSEDGLHGTLVVQRLATLNEESETYQLWLIEDGVWEDGGTLNVDEDGYGARYASASNLLTAYDAFAVTVEPAGGSASPTGPVVLRGEP